MLDRFKTTLMIFLGLGLGAVLGSMVLWTGTQRAARTLHHNLGEFLSTVIERQNSMADMSMDLEKLLPRLGLKIDRPVFKEVEERRARLAGAGSTEEKLVMAQDLERSLLVSGRYWTELSSRPQAKASITYKTHGILWGKSVRLLVREEMALEDAVQEYNRALTSWPGTWVLTHRSFYDMISTSVGGVWHKTQFMVRLGLDYAGYYFRRAASLVGQQQPPQPPVIHYQAPHIKERAFQMVSRPLFMASAPLPESEYREIQYNEDDEYRADTDVGEEKPILEEGRLRGPKVTVPQPQKTVTYK